jgi:hypothetical protein
LKSLSNIQHRNKAYTTNAPSSEWENRAFYSMSQEFITTEVNASMKNLDDMLDNVLFVYLFCFSRVLDDSPFFLMYGREAILPQDLAMNLKIKQKESQDKDNYKIQLLKTLKSA